MLASIVASTGVAHVPGLPLGSGAPSKVPTHPGLESSRRSQLRLGLEATFWSRLRLGLGATWRSQLRATHARKLLPAALAPVPFGFVLARVLVYFAWVCVGGHSEVPTPHGSRGDSEAPAEPGPKN
jgi:hypothetical protein